MSLIQGLAEFDRLRGKEPINPTVIEGFGQGQPPAPPLQVGGEAQPQIKTARELFGDPVEPGLAEGFDGEGDPAPVGIPPSPLVHAGLMGQAAPVQSRTSSGPAAPILPELPVPELAIGNDQAFYKGHAVTLTADEKDAVTKVVLKAVRRQIEEFYVQVAGSRPRRVREKPKKVRRKGDPAPDTER